MARRRCLMSSIDTYKSLLSFVEFGRQFSEQQRVLDSRTDNKILLINDLQEFFKRRSEIDMEYGKSMDRLCDRFNERFQKQRANYGLGKWVL